MTIYIGKNKAHKSAVRLAASRKVIRRIARDIYSDDFERPPEQIVSENLLAIIARRLPDWHLAYSSAAVLGARDGIVFLSGPKSTHASIELPGLKVVRLPDLPHPEIQYVEAPTTISSRLAAKPEPIRIAVSSPLQTVFECLSMAKRYPEKKLPDHMVLELISNLSPADYARAKEFAVRNRMQKEYSRYLELLSNLEIGSRLALRKPVQFEMFFYDWHVGTLRSSPGNFEFTYAPNWRISLNEEFKEKEKTRFGTLPFYFENFLPEGWTHRVICDVLHIEKNDPLSLMRVGQKFLSNISMRNHDFAGASFQIDSLPGSFSDFGWQQTEVRQVKFDIASGGELGNIFRRKQPDVPMILPGAKPKLPVRLESTDQGLTLKLGTATNSVSHIVKFQTDKFPHLIENEWASLELARRAGLRVANARQVESRQKWFFAGRALLSERFDVPHAHQLKGAVPLAWQQDLTMLLGLPRTRKYEPSAEIIAAALLTAGLSEEELHQYLKHLLFSYMIGNGDLHAKNISMIQWFMPGNFGGAPQISQATYSPIYDLMNTRVFLPQDHFALTVNGKNDKLKLADFCTIAAIAGISSAQVEETAQQLAASAKASLPEVLQQSGLPMDLCLLYATTLEENLKSLAVG
jgi:serine/threonine-protein kinase HipA